MSVNLEDYVASIPGFPKEGVLFRDVTPIIENYEAMKTAVDQLAAYGRSVKADLVAGPESRGFIFGVPTAMELKVGFSVIRKPGKLPRPTVSKEYALEYGTGVLHMHKDSVKPGQRVLIVDDLLATGGTAKAAAELVEELGGIVAGFAFIIELEGLPGRQVLEGYDVFSLLVMSDS